MVQGALKDKLRETLQDKLREKLGLGKPASEAPPAEQEDDPVKKALDRLFR